MSVITKEKRDTVMNQIVHLYRKIQPHHPVLAQKMLDLADKVNRNEVVIGFAGHFSAGKSSMINYLAQKDLLPSSPIPTSANIVKLSSGDPYTTVYFNEAPPEKYIGDIPLDAVKDFCKDGESIKEIEISRPVPSIPEYVKVLDTPGVDSTNDADRVVTEASLHVMDFMYYVMDYNHVQSEVNLNFLVEMQKRNIPFSIIINQVDKHQKEELSFDSFTKSVHESFSLWGITPENIYYTSLKEPDHPYSDLESLQTNFRELFEQKETASQAAAHLYGIVNECIEAYREKYEAQTLQIEADLNALKEVIEEKGFKGAESLKERQENRVPQAKDQFEDRVKKFITNAYLMPSTVREKAASYLQSEQPGFKVGLLFARKKTEEERAERKQAFCEEVDATVEKNLIWPLKDRLRELLQQVDITNEKLLGEAETLSLTYPTEKRVETLIESGASVTGEYVLRYTDQLSKDIQKHYRAVMQEWWQQIKEDLEQQTKQESNRNYELLQAMDEKDQLEKRLKAIEADISTYKQSLLEALEHPEVTEEQITEVSQEVKEREEEIIEVDAQTIQVRKEEVKDDFDEARTKESSDQKQPALTYNLEAKAESVRTILKGVPGFEHLRSQLKEKQQRLRNRQYTIALFGAFSAGKSSFANALLGEKILPVSPNPTTATINKIVPPNEHYEHKSVLVKVKSEKELVDDLFHATNESLTHQSTLEAAYETIAQWDEETLNQLVHQKKSFLQAFLKGYGKMKDHVGVEMEISWDKLSSFVSEEETSCFIEWVEIYFDCEWTRKGVTLVDTPGADSVNARHTDVSFEYIKNADAILFVTYFNHPFSKADESFLKQLGRVKDAFSMDKMFFIINAADLASSKEEKRQVEDYVAHQLQSFQIRKPRLNSLSSLYGLKDKLANEMSHRSGLALFEERFEKFLKHELTGVLQHSIQNDMEFAATSLKTYIDNASLNEQQKAEHLKRLEENKHTVFSIFHDRSTNRAYDQIQQKVEKQVFYAHERMMLNFNEFFKNHINPSVVNGSNQHAKSQLEASMKPLVKEVQFEMNQELRAIAVRMEAFIQQLVNRHREELQTELSKIEPSLVLENKEWSFADSEVMVFNEEIPVSLSAFHSSLKMFKGTKSFFEGNEKEEMKDQIASILNEPLRETMVNNNDRLAVHFHHQFEEQLQEINKEWEKEIEQYYESQMYSLKGEVNSYELKERLSQIKECI
ncbi:GTPase [Halobacillus andaensis]|uniref:GTPase n=1 Tax=Halobacillus andaensis TaxID=1176239 RepID=A0A917AZP6_HALAA|nr:dynamin family protein [Halobacillus andaensis]MBP2003348.1 putative GTPase [Halobacillus andaensis]GGF09974.1 GTPase [Halobacillus andaensis]